MEHEPRVEPARLTGIHINLTEQAIEFEDRYGTVGRLCFSGETVLYEGEPLLLTPTSDPLAPPAVNQAPRAAGRPRRSQPPAPDKPRTNS